MNVAGYIRTANASNEMRARARVTVAEMITNGDLLAYQGRSQSVRASDFGSCRLALWAEMHDLNDITRDPIDDSLSRLDVGALMGAWLGALLEQGAVDDGWNVALEYTPVGGGHIDALLYHNPQGIAIDHHVVEFKTGYDTGIPKADSAAHQLQAAKYALATDAARFTLCYVKVAAPKGKRIAQFTFDAEPYRELVAQEIKRLESAFDNEAPDPDPLEVWRCYTCRYGACSKNKNKAKADTAARDLEELFA